MQSVRSHSPSFWDCLCACGDSDDSDDELTELREGTYDLRIGDLTAPGPREVVSAEHVHEEMQPAIVAVVPQKIQAISSVFTAVQLPVSLAELITSYAPYTPHPPYASLCQKITSSANLSAQKLETIHAIISETGVLTLSSSCLTAAAPLQQLVAGMTRNTLLNKIHLVGPSLCARALFQHIDPAALASLQQLEIAHDAVMAPASDTVRHFPIAAFYARAVQLTTLTIHLPRDFAARQSRLCLPSTLSELWLYSENCAPSLLHDLFTRSLPATPHNTNWTRTQLETATQCRAGVVITKIKPPIL